MFENFWELKLIDLVSIVISLITLFVTVSIPVQIMKLQRYSDLTATYMSHEFGYAFHSVIKFFYDDCCCDVEKIPAKYKERYLDDFKKLRGKSGEKIDIHDVLHYQRRLLNDYFCELEMCRESSFFLRRIIHREWTTSEAWVVKILIYMNKSIDADPELFKDISGIRHDKMPKTKGLSKCLEHFYNALKTEQKEMQV